MNEQAINKIDQELKQFNGGSKEKAVSTYVAKTLKDFCKDETFALAVANSDKTLSDCCKAIMEKCGNHISDFEVYKKAAQFYFPGAKVNFAMEIKIDGHAVKTSDFAPKEKIVKKTTKKDKKADGSIQISLFDV